MARLAVQPLGAAVGLAFGAMTVAAGVVQILAHAAAGALLDPSSQHRRAAGRQVFDGTTLLDRQPGQSVLLGEAAEDGSDVQAGSGHVSAPLWAGKPGRVSNGLRARCKCCWPTWV